MLAKQKAQHQKPRAVYFKVRGSSLRALGLFTREGRERNF